MTLRTYRDENTGAIWRGSAAAGRAFSHLKEVDDDAKPLAYLPIPAERIAALQAPTEAPEPVLVERDDEEKAE